jgi:hypothetical protein
MAYDTPIVVRVRGEFLEMPGLRLTLPQACRFLQLEAPVCTAVLDHLVRTGFLERTAEGTFTRL